MSTETVKKTKAPAKPKAVKTPEGEAASAVNLKSYHFAAAYDR